MRRLIAGPWCGEFGWELMSWQGRIRELSRSYDETIVCSDDGHQALYADFAKLFIPHRLLGERDCYHFRPSNPGAYFGLMDSLSKMDGDHAIPERQLVLGEQEFVRYGDAARCPADLRFDVLVHVRQKRDTKVRRSWPEAHAARVVADLAGRGLTVGAMGVHGTPAAGAVSVVGLPLRELMDVLAAAKVLVGPCSGPTCLALLCGTPSRSTRCQQARTSSKE